MPKRGAIRVMRNLEFFSAMNQREDCGYCGYSVVMEWHGAWRCPNCWQAVEDDGDAGARFGQLEEAESDWW